MTDSSSANEAPPAVRFVMVTLVPQPLRPELELLMQEFGRMGECRTALAYPPHVTLRTGVVVPETEVEAFSRSFRDHLLDRPAFRVESSEFAHSSYETATDPAERKHFFGYLIRESRELLALHDHLEKFSLYRKPGPPREYWPHLSIAYNDVTDSRAKSLDKEIERRRSAGVAGVPGLGPVSWICDNVTLLQKGADSWVEFLRVPLTPRPASS